MSYCFHLALNGDGSAGGAWCASKQFFLRAGQARFLGGSFFFRCH
jgi:hypothetical protein